MGKIPVGKYLTGQLSLTKVLEIGISRDYFQAVIKHVQQRDLHSQWDFQRNKHHKVIDRCDIIIFPL